MQQAAELKVGIFVVAVVAIGLFVVSQLQGGLAAGKRGYEFEIWFQDAPGIGTGSPIRLSGVDIGEVIAKDIITVTESVSFAAAPDDEAAALLPFVRITTWSVGQPGEAGYAGIEVERRRLSTTERRAQEPYSRQRSVAQLKLRVKNQFEMYSGYKYSISGGLVFGDKQLTVTDVGPNGVPLPDDERGVSIVAQRREDKRVAVLGGAPPSVDRIVGTVQDTIDQETSQRVKQIVANIERATDEAAELVYTMRTTVQGNQGNADRTMSNLAAATDEIRTGVNEARTLARRSIQNIEQVTETGTRLARDNEARLNRIVGNIERASASVSRMASESEGEVAAAVRDARGIITEVRDMVAANRTNFDHIATRLTEVSDDLAGLSGESRAEIQQILEATQAAVADVRTLLASGQTEITTLLGTANETAANVRDITAEVRDSTGTLTRSLTESSENLRVASGNVAALTGDERLGRILDNVEGATSEAQSVMGEVRGAVQDIRSLTGDAEMQENIRATTREVRSAAEGINRTIGGFSSYQPSVRTDVYYVPDQSRWQGDVHADIVSGRRTSFHVGVDDVTRSPLWTVQLGSPVLTPGLRARYGFYRGQLGLGADYRLDSRGTVSGEFWDFEDPQVDLRFVYQLPWGLSGLVGVEDAFDRFDWTWGVRIGTSLW